MDADTVVRLLIGSAVLLVFGAYAAFAVLVWRVEKVLDEIAETVEKARGGL